MKKNRIALFTLLMGLGTAGVLSAAPSPDGDVVAAYQINSDLETKYNRDERIVTDRNPTCYKEQNAAGHVVAAWVKDGVVYTAINEKVTKTYKINNDVTTVWQGGNDGRTVQFDRNPTCYTKKTTLDGKIYESWIEDDIAYTSVNGSITKAYKINSDVKRSWEGGGNGRISEIDQNPIGYNKLEIGNQTVESWILDDTVYTKQSR